MIFLDRVDAAPLQDDDFSFSFNSWIANTVDTLNETLLAIQNDLNLFVVQSYTTAEIVALSATAPDGSLWYDPTHTPPVYVGKINGALVQFATTPYP